MKQKSLITLTLLLALFMAVGCGQTHRQQWYQASVAFTGTVNTTTILVERGVLDAEDIQPLMTGIEQANESLKELLPVADICDNQPEACNEQTFDYLMAQVSSILIQLDAIATEGIEER